MQRDHAPKKLGFLLIPKFSMLAFSAALEPLRSANRLLSQQTAYEWRLYSLHDPSVEASNGISIAVNGDLTQMEWAERLFICSSLHTEDWAQRDLLRQLKLLAHRGRALGGISNGAYLLAAAGVLNGYRCTTHWEHLPAFHERYPHLKTTDNLYEIDRDRYTCAGGTAALDLMLHLITDDYGQALALAVSEQFMHERIRSPIEQQKTAQHQALSRYSPKLAAAIKLMNNSIENPLQTTEIAHQIGVSLRQLERLFHKYIQYTPQRYYLHLRLQQAQLLLEQTGLSVMNIALATGFASQSHFTKCYREYFGLTPRQSRHQPHQRTDL